MWGWGGEGLWRGRGLGCAWHNSELETHGADHLEQRFRIGRPFARQAFVEAFAGQAGVFGKLAHATGAGNATHFRIN